MLAFPDRKFKNFNMLIGDIFRAWIEKIQSKEYIFKHYILFARELVFIFHLFSTVIGFYKFAEI